MTSPLNPQDRRLAKLLVRLLLEAPESGSEEVSAALARVLKGRPVQAKRAFLIYLRRCMRRGLREREVLVEHAGPVDEAEIAGLVSGFQERVAHKLSLRLHANDDLLGGLRLTLGDIVYDSSVAGRLRALEAATAADI